MYAIEVKVNNKCYLVDVGRRGKKVKMEMKVHMKVL